MTGRHSGADGEMASDAASISSSRGHGGAQPPASGGCAAPQAGLAAALFSPGTNCCTVVGASHASVLIDGAEYFRHLEAALRRARRSIFILGWDFDGRIRLRLDQDADTSPPLGYLLRHLVEQNPELQVHILVWSVSVLHGPSAVAPALLGSPWEDHPRIHMKLDTHHPFYAAHHQKIVCIDGSLAFAGGIDLTVRRWDRKDHAPADPVRIDLDGAIYPPVHDIQIAVDGEAARTLCEMAAGRWLRATGISLNTAASGAEPVWPPNLRPDFRDVEVAIARTEPAYAGRAEACEAGALTLDMIAAARRSIYIEAQYMTASTVGDALAAKLAEPDGPDIVVIMTRKSKGLIERFAMSSNRDRLIRRLARVDRFKRLRVLYPVVPGGTNAAQVVVHAKLIIIDDKLLRVGSSNLNNRSIGLDTECDLAIEARTQADRRAIDAIRNRLLAEHLDCSEAVVADAQAAEGGLIAAIDRLNVKARGLRPFAAMTGSGPTRPIMGTFVLDPSRPFRFSFRSLRSRSRTFRSSKP
jgi:phosphatidylserine/phosphatidylglycerophosphate/cardiolipin synthase-like enzyme